MTSGLMEEFVARFHGRTLEQDLKLAGMWYEDYFVHLNYVPPATWDQNFYEHRGHGLAFNCRKDGKWYKADVITYEATPRILKQQQFYNSDPYKYYVPYDSGGNKVERMPLIALNFV